MARKRNRNSEGGHGRKGRRGERVRNRAPYEFMPDPVTPGRSPVSDEGSGGRERNSGDSDSSASRSDRSSS
jgi:hypothetical protein